MNFCAVLLLAFVAIIQCQGQAVEFPLIQVPPEILASLEPSVVDPNSYNSSIPINPESSGCGVANNILSPTIIGGSVTARNEFPWQVLLVINKWNGGSYYCGASLISNQWVLTAAHCLDSAHSANLYLGAQDITINEPNRIGFTSNQWLIHPQWNSNTLFADIALIKLPVMINFNAAMSPICLPDSTDSDHVNDQVLLTGWGKISDASTGISSVLRKAYASVISNTLCQSYFGTTYVTSGNICSSFAGTGTCNGDSGGPMNYRQADGSYRHIGITSFGSGAGCQSGYPNAFTRTRSYLNWICSVTGSVGCPVPTTPTPVVMDCRSKPNGNYPDPANPCSGKFYMCSNQIAYLYNCASGGLVFNPSINACDYARNVYPCNIGR